MNIKETTIQAATKGDRLADASVELVDGGGNSILISEIRILRNKKGQLCIAMPGRSVNHGGHWFEYIPHIECSRELQQKIEDAVLAAFEEGNRAESQVPMQA